MLAGLRKLLPVLGLLTPAAVQAQAEVRSQGFDVAGSVPGACAMGSAAVVSGQQANFRGLNGSTLQIDQLVDPTTLSTNAATVEVALTAVCQVPHRLVITSQNNGLYQTSDRPPAAASGFATAVPYRATARWGSDELLLNADAGVRRINEASLPVGSVSSGAIIVRVEIAAGATDLRANAPLVAGFYGDTLRVTLEPMQ